MGVHHQNGVSDNEIKNLFRIARTMTIHDALRWNDASEKSLCTMSMTHAVHLHNHTPHIFSGMPPDEVWTRSKYSHSDLHNDHPWGFSTYVLEPIMQDGKKLSNWMTRYKRD